MNTTNPLQPQGSIPPKGKSNVRIAIFTILAIHVVLLGGLLIQGCKPGAKNEVAEQPIGQQMPDLAPMSNDVAIDSILAPGATSAVTPEVMSNVSSTPTASYATAPTAGTTPVATSATGSAPTATTMISDPVQTPGEAKTHTIAKGDMLYTIAKKYGVSLKAIEEANPGINAAKLQIGQQINVPAPTVAVASATTTTSDAVAPISTDYSLYTVKSGDALEKIARHHGTTVKAIKSANNMKTDRINVGQKLKIPAKAAAASEPAPVSGASNG